MKTVPTSVTARRVGPLVLLSAAVLVAFGLGLFLEDRLKPDVRPSEITIAGDPNDHGKAVAACIDRSLEKIKPPPKITTGLYERLWRLCSNEVFNGLFLEDFLIRREKFLRQYLDERVTLWLVVSITISGVLLAAAQLFMSFKLASRGIGDFAKDSELALENTKLSIRSSITGAIILFLSLAFFMVYVIWIYTTREVPIEKPSSLQPPSEWQDGTAGTNASSGSQSSQGVQASQPKGQESGKN